VKARIIMGTKTLRRSHYMMTDTPSHFAWSESGVCNADRKQSGRRQSERGRTGARKVGRQRESTRSGTPNSDERFSSSARQISPKFSRSLGEGRPCRGAKKFRNLTREFRENRGQSTPRSKISTPHISPKWGAIPPNKICYY